MLNWIWMGMIVVGVVVAALLGQLKGEDGIVEGMFSMIKTGVVSIAIPLSAIMMLWLGIMRLAEASGMIQVVARLCRPVMKRLFPEVPEDHPAMSAMVMNMAANMLGLGNAATPLGLKAMQHLDDLNPDKGTATNSMCTFLAINTSSVTLIPATAIGLLAAQGISEPYAIVGTTIGATIFSTAVAILSVKLFEKMPIFNRRAPVVEELTGASAVSQPASSRGISARGQFVLVTVVALFIGIVFLETFPAQRTAMQNALGLSGVVEQLNAKPPSLEEKPSSEADPVWQRGISAMSVAAIPFVLVFFIVFAALKRIPVYEEFVEGAKEGWAVAVRIMPFIVAMLAALAILRNSGALLLFQNLLRPVLEVVKFPVELVPMALMRPLSGSGSQGVLVEILTNESFSDTLKYTAATMFGSTETTFYVLAVYFGSVAVRRTRHALAAGLCADAAGMIAAVVICRAMFG
ncbi:MAG: nucleoside recognition protein [Verrucomicrobiales bacterium]|jgi:spore maturation protein SpmA|nr:nucleoside recognition protein [Verrucomicrobiales bacterium]MBP9222821.1 nucleoside recognition protein [Verrucomicrobiales bacterium]